MPDAHPHFTYFSCIFWLTVTLAFFGRFWIFCTFGQYCLIMKGTPIFTSHVPFHSPHCAKKVSTLPALISVGMEYSLWVHSQWVHIAFPHKHWNAYSQWVHVCPSPFCDACTCLSTPFLSSPTSLTQSDPTAHTLKLHSQPPRPEPDTCNSVCVL